MQLWVSSYAGLGEAPSAIAEGQKGMAINALPKIQWMVSISRQIWHKSTLYWGTPITPFPFSIVCCRYPGLNVPLGTITPALLRLYPVWDQIRNDSRFQKLVSEK